MADRHAIRFDENGAPISLLFDDPFFSRKDGAAETRHTFHAGNNLPAAWAARTRFTIGETGFGTALNTLETLGLWRATGEPGAELHFVSFEAFPLTRDAIAECLAAWPWHAELAAELVAALPAQWPETGSAFCALPGFTLEVVVGLAETTLPAHSLNADAWFLDGHSPAKNGAMWSAELMQAVFDHTAPGGTFATYTAAGWVRRNLQAAGFTVEKRPGFGSKREMMCGARPA